MIQQLFRLFKTLLAAVLKLLRLVFKPLLYSLSGGLVVLLILAVLFLNSKPDLLPWHTRVLDQEFTRAMPIDTFAGYLQQEQRLFEQLDRVISGGFDHYDKLTRNGRYNRYSSGSMSSPARWPVNWNRSIELSVEQPVAAVLLLHGMSDSPYSMRNLATRMQAQGMAALSLRLPGHGTLPSGLVNVEWEDMAAAVRLAVVYLKQKYPELPLFIIGYSNGATLALNYALDASQNEALPVPDKMVFLSPSVAVSRFAMLAIWQSRIAHLLGLKKLEWQALMLEYDPFKYGSFAINAGDQVYQLTEHIKAQIAHLEKQGRLELPPILAFQSVVDDTVSASAVVDQLFAKLPDVGNRLVLLDLNREADAIGLLKNSPSLEIARLFQRQDLNFELDLLTNKTPATLDLELRRKKPGGKPIEHEALELEWPNNLFSLSHIALPFPPDDPLYGGRKNTHGPGVALGDLEYKGERAVLAMPDSALMRLRWNPFYYWMEDQIMNYLEQTNN